ncbi:MAG TPA: FecR domain-containing protein [Tepidisphaeraceae bacterium]|nr:FecR domain-containing protein [Tepidisphaeraceae bacterium]
MVKSNSIAFLMSVVLGFSASAVFAATQSQPAELPGGKLEATVTGVEGNVQVRKSADQPWAKAEVGMKVDELAEFRTGPKSAVRFTIPPDQTITLDRLGVVKLLEAVNDSGKLKTSLGMKYGRTRFDIEAAGREHDASISSPSSTLAIRGTKVSLYDQRPFRAEAVSLTGRASFRDGKKQIAFGNRNAGKTKVNVDDSSAASAALTETTTDPSISLARTEAEAPLVDTLLRSGATVFFDREVGIKVVRGGSVPNDQQLIPALPGVFSIVARWHSDADINLSVATPGGSNNGGEVLYPTGALATNSSGGHVAFDHRGGPNGGIEVVYFTKTPPDGLYGIGLTLISGNVTTAQVDAFKNGQRVGIFNGQSTVPSVSIQVPAPIPGFVDGAFAGVVPVNVPLPSNAPLSAQSTKTKNVLPVAAQTIKRR